MKCTPLTQIVAAIMLTVFLARQAPAQSALNSPTLDELTALLDGGKPSDLLKQLMIIRSSQKLLATYDASQLSVLKAEALLQNKDKLDAIEAFKSAQKEAADEKSRAYARACEVLVTRATGMAYIPHPTPATATAPALKPDGIALTDRKHRHEALLALFADEFKAAQPKLQKALAAKSLPDMVPAVKTLDDLEMLELAATSATAQVEAAKASFVDHLQTVVVAAVKNMQTTAEGISRLANTIIRTILSDTDSDGNLVQWAGYRKRGLTTSEANNLKEIIATCNRIEPALDEIIKQLHVDGNATKSVATEATSLAATATGTLNTDYTPEVAAPR